MNLLIMVTAVSAEQMGVMDDDNIHRIREILAGNETAVSLLDEFIAQRREEYEAWMCLAGLRHVAYKKGYAGGDRAIQEAAIEKIYEERRQRQDQSEVIPHQELLVYKTAICITAIANIMKEQRAKLLGLTRARFLKNNPQETANKYINFSPEGEAIQLKKYFSSKTPLNDLLQLLAFIEKQEEDISFYKDLKTEILEFLIRHLLTGNEKLNDIAGQFLSLRHFEAILSQMPDTLSHGRIGGKATGILLAYAALEKDDKDFNKKFFKERSKDPRLRKVKASDIDPSSTDCQWLDQNSSTFIGTEVFESVFNDEQNAKIANVCLTKGPYRRNEKIPDERFEEITEAMLEASFPLHIDRQLQMLFSTLHESPIVVRSSSELEDRFGASFAGIYESVELANAGNFEDDFKAFKKAILTIYASVFTDRAMTFRKELELLSRDEEMGILIQTLNGEEHIEGDEKVFYPDLSIVAMSHATQSLGKNPERGAMRMVIGLGRAAVGEDRGMRVEEGKPSDNTRPVGRFVMFDKPSAFGREQAPQPHLFVLNRGQNASVQKIDCSVLLAKNDLCSSGIHQTKDRNNQINFEYFLSLNPLFALRIEYIIQKLKHLLGYDVDCEFTAQWDEEQNDWTIQLVQCRPQTIPPNLIPSRIPKEVSPEHILVQAKGAINGTRLTNVSDILYIDPQIFTECTMQDRRCLRNIINEINKRLQDYLVIAPRRWGSNDGNAGIVVGLSDFTNAAGIAEVCHNDPSFGAHFLQVLFDLGKAFTNFSERDIQRNDFFENAPHSSTLPDIKDLIPHYVRPETAEKLTRYIKVINVEEACQKLGFSTKDSKKPMVVHLAQDSTTGKGLGDEQPLSLYLARQDQQLPEEVSKLAEEISPK